MKAGLFLLGLTVGTLFGFSLAAWALYEPIPTGPAKYAFTRSAGPVPPYILDGKQKSFWIECISVSEKDCPQPTSIPEPGTGWLVLVAVVGLWMSRTPG